MYACCRRHCGKSSLYERAQLRNNANNSGNSNNARDGIHKGVETGAVKTASLYRATVFHKSVSRRQSLSLGHWRHRPPVNRPLLP